MTPAILVNGLRKSYGPTRAVDGVSLRVERGEIFALLGPNGAGKTTVVEILEGFRSRDDGEVRVLGFDPLIDARAMREHVGILLQDGSPDRTFTVLELLSLYRSFYAHPRAPSELIEILGLSEKRDARIGSLSSGQARRVDLALALIGDPELLFLDEPTAGLDPEVRQRTWNFLRRCKEDGKSIMFTSHNLDEVEQVADRAAILVSGRVRQEGAVAEMQHDAAAETLISFRVPEGVSLPDISRIDSNLSFTDRKFCEIRTTAPTAVLARLTGWATDLRIELAELQVRRPSLNDVYLQLMELGDCDVARDRS